MCPLPIGAEPAKDLDARFGGEWYELLDQQPDGPAGEYRTYNRADGKYYGTFHLLFKPETILCAKALVACNITACGVRFADTCVPENN